MCHNSICNCQKEITFTPKLFQLEGTGFTKSMKKLFKGTERRWNNFNKPRLKKTAPIISAGIVAKTKNRQSAQLTSNNLETLTGDELLSLTDMHVSGLRLRFICFHFK